MADETGSNFEKQYKDTQAKLTQTSQTLATKSQELDAIRKQLETEELVPRAQFEEQYGKRVSSWAKAEPDKFLDWAGLRDKFQPAGVQQQSAISPEVFNPESDAHKEYVRLHGEPALQREYLRQNRDVFLDATGVGKELAEMRAQQQALQERNTQLESSYGELSEATSALHLQQQMMKDPDLATVHEFHEALSKDQDLYKRSAKEWKERRDAPAHVAQPEVPSPEQAAELAKRAEGTPVGSGSPNGSSESHLKGFDLAVHRARQELAGSRT